MSFLRTVALITPLVAACGSSHAPTLTTSGDGGVIDINGTPTGSITTPSLCERTQVDTKVLSVPSQTFAFLWANDHYQLVYDNDTDGDIYSVRLTPAGKMIGTPVVVEKTPDPSTLPFLLATSSGYLVAWEDAGTSNAAHVHALDADGNPTGGSHVVAKARASQLRPVLATSPQGVAVAWMDQDPGSVSNISDVGTSTTWLGLLDANNDIRTDIPAVQLDAANQSGYPWLAGDAKSLALLFSDSVSGRTDVFFSDVSPTLAVSPANVRGAGALDAALLGRLLSTDFGYLATWEDHRSGTAEIYMSLLDTTGKAFFSGLVEEPMTGNANWSHQAWNGSAAGIVYYQFRGGKPQVFLTFIDATGARINGAADSQVSDTTEEARYPDVQWNGSSFGVLWIDTRDGTPTIYFNDSACKQPAPT